MSRRQRQIGYRIAFAGLTLIAALTLLPEPEEAARAAATPVTCILCGDLGTVDFLLNVLLFIPLGAGLLLAGFSWRRTVVLAGILTCLIELLQMGVIAGRDASLGDVLANTLGGALGALLAAAWRGFVFPTERRARRLALAYALGLLWVWAGTAWALGPALPQGVRWYGAWAPEFDNFERFAGTPLLVTAGGEPLLPGPALDQRRLDDAVTANPSLAFRAVLAGPTRGLAPIGVIVDEWHRDVIFIGQDATDLSFGVRMRAAILKLRNPMAVLHRGLSASPGDTVEADGALRDGTFELSARDGGRLVTLRLPLSASWGWSLVTPWAAGYGQEMTLLTALWVGGLVGVLAYWSSLSGRAGLAIVPVTVAGMLAVVPYGAGFPPAHWSEWVAALAGILLGVAAAAGASRERQRIVITGQATAPNNIVEVTP